MIRQYARSLAASAALLLITTSPALAGDTVKVFILAGQSNMEGKAQNALMDHQATDDKTKAIFAHLRKGDEWIVREDAYIKYLNRHGGLTVGYGSPGRTGVELEFGTVVADHYEEPVLLIKACWGGHSLFKLFRSPSAGMPSDEALAEELAGAVKRVENSNEKNNQNKPLPTMAEITSVYGSSYRNMLKEVAGTFDNYEELFPALKGKKLEMAGFVWFQGWNDQYGAEDEYESNMQHFIEDVRKDLKAPNLPFVIGVMGQNGSKKAKGAMLTIQEAQLAMPMLAAFKGNVESVRTDVLIDKAAEKLYPSWRENLEEWKLTGSDFAYHYLGSAIWHIRMGHGFGDAMVKMLK